jgi:AraC-like DNA-binding protein
VLLTLTLYGQDTVKGKSEVVQENFEALAFHIEHTEGTAGSWVYIDAYIKKAKMEGNGIELVEGYKSALHESAKNMQLTYADSMVMAAKRVKDDGIIGSAYLTKGIVFYSLKNYIAALDNYIIANQYISHTNDAYLKHKVKYNIAHIKYYLGFYNEAISLFKDCIAYYKAEDAIAYLNSLHSLALCYTKTGQIQRSTEVNSFALKESGRLKVHAVIPYLNQLEGINDYYNGKYTYSIQKLNSILKETVQRKDFANESVINFYIGKNYWALNKKEAALPYLKKVDEIFTKWKYIRPDIREDYELLISYYKKNKSFESQLFYINRLLCADSLLDTNYKYLSLKIHKDYDTKKLLEAKKEVEKILSDKERYDLLFILVIALLIFTLAHFAYIYMRTKRRYRERFEILMNTDSSAPVKRTESENVTLDLNPEVVAAILTHLEDFEQTNKFLEKDINAPKLAALFDTNYKYLSKVVRYHRDKKFVNYVNDLKIDYIVSMLQKEQRFRMYTNKALAEEAGFSTTQHFTNAFISRTGISPTYFIQELQKHLDEQAK